MKKTFSVLNKLNEQPTGKKFLLGVIFCFILGVLCLPSQQATVIKNVNLVPMTAEKVIPKQTVVIEGGKISKIGSANAVAIPEGALIIDGTGKYLLPGLADMHVHVEENDPVLPLNLFLANGVTTIRSLDGDRGSFILKWRDDINQGLLDGPTIYTCGSVLNQFLQDLPVMVQDQKNRGYDFLKIYANVQSRGFNDAMKTAHKLGMYTVGHIPFAVGLDGVLAGGMNEIAHVEEIIFSELSVFDRTKTFMNKDWQQLVLGSIVKEFMTASGLHIEDVMQKKDLLIKEIAEKLIKHNVAVCTTVGFADLMPLKLSNPQEFLTLPDMQYCTKEFIEAIRAGKEKDQLRLKGMGPFLTFYQAVGKLFFSRLHRAGVRMVLGTDAMTYRGNISGISAQRELECLTQWGLTPYQALVLATVNASKVVELMNGKNEFGTIEVGKKADLILMPENPLQDIRNIRELSGVMAAGKWYTRAKLTQMINVSERNYFKKKASVHLLQVIEEKGIDAAIGEYWQSKDPKNQLDRCDVGWEEMYALGYILLKKGQIEDAIKIFELNLNAYPDDYDSYGSMGDAYLAKGDRQSAVYFYKRALNLNPLDESTRTELASKLNRSIAQ